MERDDDWEGIFLREAVKATNKDSIVIDAGCGANEYLRYLEKGFGLGIDIVPWPEAKGTNFVIAALEMIPLKDDCCNVVITHSVLEHLKEPAIVVKEVARILRKGGLLIFGTPHRYHLASLAASIVPWTSFKSRLTGLKVYRTYYRCNTVRSIRRDFVNGGLLELRLVRTYDPVLLILGGRLLWPLNQLYRSRLAPLMPPHHLVGVFVKSGGCVNIQGTLGRLGLTALATSKGNLGLSS
jgi:SAM-dependent methyltransferase